MNSEYLTDQPQENFQIQLLASTLAHEIRNPLQSMKLQLDAASRGYLTESTFDRLNAEVARIEKIVQKVQQFSQPVKMEPSSLCILEVLNSCLESIRYWLSASGIILEEDYSALGKSRIHGDAILLEQVILNLITNAIQAMPNGGCLSIRAENSLKDIVIEVSDTGEGMSSETLERLGSPFFTTKAKGSGLGVAFCRSVLAMHHASLIYSSRLGEGTKAILRFPIEREDVAC